MTDSTTPGTKEELFRLLAQSGLLKDDLLQTKKDQFSDSETSATILNQLVDEQFLTSFQAAQLLAGKHRGFFLSEKFKILKFLGEGGTSRVLLCEHLILQRLVAVKLLSPQMTSTSGAFERFLREARATASLDHPNIARVFDADQTNLGPCLVMEYVDGTNLHDLAAKQDLLPIHRVANYISQAAMGLQQAFQAGLVHRDVKPANLMLDRTGTVKLLDLGLARFFDPDRSDNLTQKIDPSSIMGTADYIAPEQVMESSSADIRADIYSLGYTMYFLLTKSLPAGSGSAVKKMVWHQIYDAEPVRNFRQDIPEELESVLNRMIRKNPDERYRTPEEIINALAPWSHQPISAPSDPEMPRIQASSYRLGLSPIPDRSSIADAESFRRGTEPVGVEDAPSTGTTALSQADDHRSMIDVSGRAASDTRITPAIASAETEKVLTASADTERVTRKTVTHGLNKKGLDQALQRIQRQTLVAIFLLAMAGVLVTWIGRSWWMASTPPNRTKATGTETSLVLQSDSARNRETEATSGIERSSRVLSGSGTTAPVSRIVLRAGGSTMIRPVMDYWSRIYEKQSGVKIEYSAVNSSKGIDGVISNFLDFGCSDVVLTDDERSAAGARIIHVPLAIGAIVPTYNVRDPSGQSLSLRFTGAMLANIYLGQITKWNDPAIAVINPGVDLPDADIKVIYRDESSGATAIWTEYLSHSSSQWKSQVGVGNQVAWPVGVPAGKNDGIADSVSRTTGAIGYAELSHAIANSLPVGQVKNQSGAFIQPSAQSIRAAAESISENSELPQNSMMDAPGPQSYPIVGICYAIIRIDQHPERGSALIDFLRWATATGQIHLEELQFGRLPQGDFGLIESTINQIKVTR